VGKAQDPGVTYRTGIILRAGTASERSLREGFLGLRFGLSWGFCGRVTKFACENRKTNKFHENYGDGRMEGKKDEINKGEDWYDTGKP